MSNLKLPHWAQMLIALAAVVVTWIMQQSAAGTLVLPAVAMTALVVLNTIIGILSPSAKPSVNASAVKAAAATTILLLALGAGIVTTQTACAQPVLPTIVKVEQVVEADLAAGVSDSQLASDVCKALGGSATTDAICANVPALISDAVALIIDSGVLGDPAVPNAQAYMARHPQAAPTAKP